MVAINSRLRPEFHQIHPCAWFPETRMWRVVLAVYGCLGAAHVALGNPWLGAACLAVSVGSSPRMRGAVGLALIRAAARFRQALQNESG